jgi:hypothetical protein
VRARQEGELASLSLILSDYETGERPEEDVAAQRLAAGRGRHHAVPVLVGGGRARRRSRRRRRRHHAPVLPDPACCSFFFYGRCRLRGLDRQRSSRGVARPGRGPASAGRCGVEEEPARPAVAQLAVPRRDVLPADGAVGVAHMVSSRCRRYFHSRELLSSPLKE